jgi:hypothetical protein
MPSRLGCPSKSAIWLSTDVSKIKADDAQFLRMLQNQQEISIDLKKISSSKAQNRLLIADDVLFVPTSLPKSAGRKATDAALQLARIAVLY